MFAMLTVEPNESNFHYHNRRIVVLSPKAQATSICQDTGRRLFTL